jgi:hypothetical protein
VHGGVDVTEDGDQGSHRPAGFLAEDPADLGLAGPGCGAGSAHAVSAVEGHLLAWHHGIGGRAYFITDDDRTDLHVFLAEQFEAYGVEVPPADLTRPPGVHSRPEMITSLSTDIRRAVEGSRHGHRDQGLKRLVVARFSGKKAAEVTLAEHETNPEVWHIPLAKALRAVRVGRGGA